ncbi:MAG TPA: hypothetical protein VHW69_16190 [Rhizomicrobium sp.]|jgi:hypothetical protein|nr:hypothetical protein [Rhizomicrobium sp.]
MNKLTQALLTGSALCALGAAPVSAGNTSAIHLSMLHGGKVINKTKSYSPDRQHITYTYGVYTSIGLGQLNQKIKLNGEHPIVGTDVFGCDNPTTKIKFHLKKTVYGKAGKFAETYSLGPCGHPIVHYGLTYKLTDPNGEGHSDKLGISASGKFEQNGTKYKGAINYDFTVDIF